jgi:hypothetical protein
MKSSNQAESGPRGGGSFLREVPTFTDATRSA